ncbi:hypothetical protein [Halarcobacter sp.]|uniref:hypothetical protein n=1 Tax=Halarcobacter sp. TaxID=2321133 RepID=UPI0029F56FA5|nr:hypothetical protein [Halarcobacter sp.]
METLNIYIDETKFEKDGKNYLALCLVIIKNDENISEIKEHLEKLYRELSTDQFLGHDEDDRLFHFTEDSMEIKPRLIELIRTFQIKGYIAYDVLTDSTEFKKTYLKIFFKLLFHRVSKNNNCDIHVFYEEQSEIKEPNIKSIIDKIKIEFTNLKLSVTKTTKKNILICLPDYLLGVFRDTTKTPLQDYMRRNYYKLNTKVRLIHDIEKDIFYSTRNPYTF